MTSPYNYGINKKGPDIVRAFFHKGRKGMV